MMKGKKLKNFRDFSPKVGYRECDLCLSWIDHEVFPEEKPVLALLQQWVTSQRVIG